MCDKGSVCEKNVNLCFFAPLILFSALEKIKEKKVTLKNN